MPCQGSHKCTDFQEIQEHVSEFIHRCPPCGLVKENHVSPGHSIWAALDLQGLRNTTLNNHFLLLPESAVHLHKATTLGWVCVHLSPTCHMNSFPNLSLLQLLTCPTTPHPHFAFTLCSAHVQTPSGWFSGFCLLLSASPAPVTGSLALAQTPPSPTDPSLPLFLAKLLLLTLCPGASGSAHLVGWRGGQALLEHQSVVLTQIFARGPRNDPFIILVALGGEGREKKQISVIGKSTASHTCACTHRAWIAASHAQEA